MDPTPVIHGLSRDAFAIAQASRVTAAVCQVKAGCPCPLQPCREDIPQHGGAMYLKVHW